MPTCVEPMPPRLRCAALALCLVLVLVLVPVAAWAQFNNADGRPQMRNLFGPLRTMSAPNKSYALAEQVQEVLGALADSKLAEASQFINATLKLDTANASLHFLNGLVYHLMARQGDVSKLDTAIEGYRTAIRFDAGQWVAHEFLGLALFEKRDYKEALASFAEVLLLRPEDGDALNRAMAAAYLSNDPAMACAMADRMRQQPASQEHRAFMRGSVLVYAACGDTSKAAAQKDGYFKFPLSDQERQRVDTRLSDWQHLHQRRAGAAAVDADGRALGVAPVRAQFTTQSAPPGARDPSTTTLPEQGTSSGSDRMVLVDVVMIRTEDAISTAKGINLLSALNLQFGGNNSAAYSRTTSSDSQSTSGPSTIIQRAISVPALNYTLNIANANNNLNEVLARPTITALEGVRSEFFSGTVLNAAVVSGGTGFSSGSVSVEKRYGVKLALLPQTLSNGMVRLAIDASRTFLKAPSSDIAFTYKLEISEIVVNANVVMRLGDTLVLSGLSERESTSVRDGVPGLQDVPLLQYLFSRQTQTEYQKSVLILITPRQAAYTWLSEETKAALRDKRDAFSPSVDVLRSRYVDWFKPYPNLASVFHHFNAADLYREFRTGDVTIDSWERMDSTRQRLKSALEFLYY